MKSGSTVAKSMLLLSTALIAVVWMLPQPKPASTQSQDKAEAQIKSHSLTVIANVRLFDGEAFVDSVDVMVSDGHIQRVGKKLETPADANVIDGTGKTLLPGLIDGHVHVFGPARSDAISFGVTTMLDMFSPPMNMPQIKTQRRSVDETDQSDVFSAGYLATVPGGHGTQYGIEVPTLSLPTDVDAWVAARIAEGSDWIKIVIESGSTWGGTLSTLSPEIVASLVEAAHKRNTMAVAHVSTYDDALMAIESGVDGLVHLFADRPIDEAFVVAAKRAGIFVVPTASVLASSYGGPRMQWLRNHETLGKLLGPMQRQSLEQSFPGSASREAMWATAQTNIEMLHEAGIPIVAGTDAPNPGTAHGISIHAELALLVGAGLDEIDALRAATSVPAKLFGLPKRGCVRVGCRADLILVDGNPAESIEETARIEGVWKNGFRVESDATSESDSRDDAEPVTAAGEATSPIDLLDQANHWVAAADDFMGGQSSAKIKWEHAPDAPALAVDVDVKSGFAFPYAGAMWNSTAIPMQPADHSGKTRLTIEFDGPGSGYQLMLFSGESQGAQPSRVMISPGQENTIDLRGVDGLDRSSLRAVGVFLSAAPDQRSFTITKARLQ